MPRTSQALVVSRHRALNNVQLMLVYSAISYSVFRGKVRSASANY